MNAMQHTVNISAQQSDGTQHADRHPYNLQQAVEDFERKYLRNILELAGWDRPTASEMLELPLDTLLHKMDRYQLLDYWVPGASTSNTRKP